MFTDEPVLTYFKDPRTVILDSIQDLSDSPEYTVDVLIGRWIQEIVPEESLYYLNTLILVGNLEDVIR
jgi:hypothetical protein